MANGSVVGFNERSCCGSPESRFAAPSEVANAWTLSDSGLEVRE